MCDSGGAASNAKKLPNTPCDLASNAGKCTTTEENPCECHVEFRPDKAAWKGEFGFDWFRDGNWPLSMSNNLNSSFEQIAGKHYVPTDKPEADQKVDTDINSYKGAFRKLEDVLNKAKAEYGEHFYQYKDRSIKKGYTAYMSLYSHENAKVGETSKRAPVTIYAVVKDVKTPPDKFELKFVPENTGFLTIGDIKPSAGEHPITVECTKIFGAEQTVIVNAIKKGFPPKAVGKLVIIPNDEAHLTKMDILKIRVSTSGTSLKGKRTGDFTADQLSFFNEKAHQAMVHPVIVEKKIDLRKVKNYEKYILKKNGKSQGIILDRYFYWMFGKIDSYDKATGAMSINVTVSSGKEKKIAKIKVILYGTVKTTAIGESSKAYPSGKFRGTSAEEVTIADGTLSITVEKDLSFKKDDKVVVAKQSDDLSFPGDLRHKIYELFKKGLKSSEKNKYDDYTKVLCFDESIGYFEGDGVYQSVGGVQTDASDYKHGYFVQGNQASVAASTHETFHDYGLPHTFDGGANADSTVSKNAKLTFQGQTTENIMDYTHGRSDGDYSNARICIYRWQWKIINSKL